MLFPATAPKQKVVFWQGPGWLKKECVHPRFTVWQAVGTRAGGEVASLP